MRLSAPQRTLLIALQAGDRLKVQRTRDGAKRYRLHARDDAAVVEVAATVVDGLLRAGLIESNMKFPAATFLLTDKGLAVVTTITGSEQTPIGPRNFA